MSNNPNTRWKLAPLATVLALTAPWCCGCSMPDADDKLRTVVADKSLSDAAALESLAREVFHLEKFQAEPAGAGQAVSLVVHGDESEAFSGFDDQSTKELGQMRASAELALLGLACRRYVEFAPQRGLEKLTLTLQCRALDAKRQPVWVDTFQFRLARDKFPQFLAKATAIDLMKQAPSVFTGATEVVYNHFDAIRVEKTSE